MNTSHFTGAGKSSHRNIVKGFRVSWVHRMYFLLTFIPVSMVLHSFFFIYMKRTGYYPHISNSFYCPLVLKPKDKVS